MTRPPLRIGNASAQRVNGPAYDSCPLVAGPPDEPGEGRASRHEQGGAK
ncbi:hypothetical protein [Streptomyces huasconensis]